MTIAGHATWRGCGGHRGRQRIKRRVKYRIKPSSRIRRRPLRHYRHRPTPRRRILFRIEQLPLRVILPPGTTGRSPFRQNQRKTIARTESVNPATPYPTPRPAPAAVENRDAMRASPHGESSSLQSSCDHFQPRNALTTNTVAKQHTHRAPATRTEQHFQQQRQRNAPETAILP